jgi:hypothetical protein
MNLMMNSIDAMKDVDESRVLTVQSQHVEKWSGADLVSDTGVGFRRSV